MRIFQDKDGNVFEAHIISRIPEGFEDITEGLIVEEGAQDLDMRFLEPVLIPATEGSPAEPEHWTNGENMVFDANDIPTLVDEEGNPYLDPSYTHVAAVAEIPAKPAHYKLQRNTEKNQEFREEIIAKIRTKRQPLLEEADIRINILSDEGLDDSAWREYRKALRNITEDHKNKTNGSWKVSVESIDVDNFEFPAKPE